LCSLKIHFLLRKHKKFFLLKKINEISSCSHYEIEEDEIDPKKSKRKKQKKNPIFQTYLFQNEP